MPPRPRSPAIAAMASTRKYMLLNAQHDFAGGQKEGDNHDDQHHSRLRMIEKREIVFYGR